MECLALNETWKNLQELHLKDNPEIGDLGAYALSLNKTWKRLQHVFLNNSGVKTPGYKFVRFNRIWKRCVLKIDEEIMLYETRNTNSRIINNIK